MAARRPGLRHPGLRCPGRGQDGDTATFELTGKTVLLTGATDGLERPGGRPHRPRRTMLLHGHDEDRGAATLTQVADAAGSD